MIVRINKVPYCSIVGKYTITFNKKKILEWIYSNS
jgi:hypothetical protein